MDDYPDHLAPDFDEGGGVATPFPEWWARVATAFPNVPEEVAREWLHRHWRHSPFAFLKSAEHRFELIDWDSADLRSIRWNFNNFADEHEPAISHGRFLIREHHRSWPTYLSEYLIANGDFPSPPIIVDNRDLQMVDDIAPGFYPAAHLLVEGHRRYAMASYLASIGEMRPTLKFWLMTRIFE
ncbi:hypothetical protein [Xanthobacter pseudotagetidis]|uniref:hypothetical protein n=1 Tax=Xanthobacter pseudotagetidis TaxID=3119911 RepID=UPI00372959BD